jgi:hypothetical protein
MHLDFLKTRSRGSRLKNEHHLCFLCRKVGHETVKIHQVMNNITIKIKTNLNHFLTVKTYPINVRIANL